MYLDEEIIGALPCCQVVMRESHGKYLLIMQGNCPSPVVSANPIFPAALIAQIRRALSANQILACRAGGARAGHARPLRKTWLLRSAERCQQIRSLPAARRRGLPAERSEGRPAAGGRLPRGRSPRGL
jgi:hypothetical protein